MDKVSKQAVSLQQTMCQFFELGDMNDYPSSYFDPESMVLITNDKALPLELRIYVNWEPCRERRHGGFLWFSPSHVFRKHHENSYVLAQDISTKQWIEWSCNKWFVVNYKSGYRKLIDSPFLRPETQMAKLHI